VSPITPDMSSDRMLAREIEKREKEVRRQREQKEFEMLRVKLKRIPLKIKLIYMHLGSIWNGQSRQLQGAEHDKYAKSCIRW